MPGFWTPCPGKRSAMGPARSMPMSFASGPLHEGCSPREARSETGQQHVVAGFDATLADGLLQRQRDGRARGVAELVDVDGDPLDREANAPGGRVDDAEVGLVRDPQVDLIESDTGRLADLGRLA